MPKEFQEFSPSLGRNTTEILLCQRVEQLCMRLIVESIFPGTRYLSGVKIVVRQVWLARAYLAEELSVAIQSRVEARFEHSFRLRRRCF